MNYSKMSDDQINLHVFEFLFGKIGEDKDMLRIWQQGKFQPCHSWADAGPIIVENKISLSNAIIRWNASSLVYDDKFDAGFKIYHSNSGVDSSSSGALRAAMIVFLMTQESEHDA